MRTELLATSALGCLGLLLTGWLGSPDPDSDGRTFPGGDHAVVLGRLPYCLSWSDRALDIREVPERGAMTLLNVSGVDLVGKSPASAGRALRERYRAKYPERVDPWLRVALVRGDREYEDAMFWYSVSVNGLANRECPAGPIPYDVPPGSMTSRSHP